EVLAWRATPDELSVGPARNRRVRRKLLRIGDGLDRAIEPALAQRRRDRKLVVTGTRCGTRVERIGLHAPRRHLRGIRKADVDHATDRATAVGPERGGREPDVADE